MENLSGCVDFSPRRPRTRKGIEGNVLIVLLGIVFVLAVIEGAVFEIADVSRERALKTEYRDRAVAGIEFTIEGIRQSVAEQFERQAWLDVASLAGNQDQARGSKECGYYNLNIQAQAAANQIFATQSHNSFQSLTAPDDPFRGSAAVVNTLVVTADAQGNLSSTTHERFNLPSLALTPEICVRQIPVSGFTLFSSTTSFQVEAPVMPAVGRIHSEGDLVISGGELTSLYPVTAGGNISLANNGSLLAQSGPNQPQLSFPVQSTTDNNWLAMSRSISRSAVLSGRDLPMTLVEAAEINQLTAQGSGTTPSAQQELWRQCSRTVLESNGTISVRTISGAAANPQERRAFTPYHSPNYPNGPIIVFDVLKAPPAFGRNSFYISSSNPNAIVLLRNASNLPGDLAIVSPLAIAVEGRFNDQGVRKAASLTAKSVSAVPVGW